MAYCLKRYQDGLNLLLKTPWLMLAKVNGAAVSVDSIVAMDNYASLDGMEIRPDSVRSSWRVELTSSRLQSALESESRFTGNAPVPTA